MKKRLKIFIIIGFSILLLLFLGTSFYVEYRVQETCKLALESYPGDKIQALVNVAQSRAECDDEKSRALWAMGQLGAKQALPYLLENYDGIEETNICIYEAQFAIKKIQNDSFNLPGFLWRWLLEK
ncbi:hypothetical protein [Maribellus mangrovi]|uniref:hypothetical protein n=1 Tax=Maribellus mangrovi TaxID=3133146 RepID=UPI0030ECF957